MSIKNTIIIIDSEPEIRKILTVTLEAENFKVIQSPTSREGLISIAKNNPVLVLLDLYLPDQDGFTTLREIRSWSTVPVIFLSNNRVEEEIIKALDLGADDYITKPFSPFEVIARIRANIRRVQQPETETIIVNGGLKIDFLKRIVYKNNLELKLTNTEYLILFLFFKNINKVLTYNYVLTEVWGPNFTHNAQYLRVFIGQIRKKIEDNQSEQNYILTESGVGYRMKLLT